MPRQGVVKNKTPAPVQITAEQLLREAWDHHHVPSKAPAAPRLADVSELREYQAHRRKTYESRLMQNRTHLALWLQYARWEAAQHNPEHARSVFERALDVDPRHAPFWVAYAEFEMGIKMVAHARNIFNKAVAILPRNISIWLKFAYMEEVLGNVDAAREVFRRCSEWRPPVAFFRAYVGFEERHREEEEENDADWLEVALRRWCAAHPAGGVYGRLARYQVKKRRLGDARRTYEEAVERVKPPTELPAGFYRAFARLEAELCHEKERAAAILKYAKDIHPDMEIGSWWKGESDESIEAGWIVKRREEIKEKIGDNPRDWNEWHAWMTLEEEAFTTGVSDLLLDAESARTKMDECFAALKAVDIGNAASKLRKNVNKADKERWWPYAYLWVRYALFLENMGEIAAASALYQECLERMNAGMMGGHMFGKIWVLAAEVEIRSGNMDRARKILGTALGKMVKLHKAGRPVYARYVEIELALGEVDRARKILERWVRTAGLAEADPKDGRSKEAEVLVQWAKIEEELNEFERTRALYELALQRYVEYDNVNLDLELNNLISDNGDVGSRSELAVWRAYIDFELSQGVSGAGELYKRLVSRHPEGYVWRSYGDFASRFFDVEEARKVWEEGHESLKGQMMDAGKQGDTGELPQERATLLEKWKEWEDSLPEGVKDSQRVEALLPKKVKRKRMLKDGSGWEEYWDFIWLDEAAPESKTERLHEKNLGLEGGLGILAAAHRWKMQQMEEEQKKIELNGNGEIG